MALSIYFLILVLWSHFLSSHVVSTTSTWRSDSDTEKVAVELYYESLCPSSADFIVNNLAKVFQQQDLISIMDLRLFPWGNAQIRDGETFDCQHGPSECSLNTVEACVISAWPDVGQHFPFINCIETSVEQGQSPQWETCCQTLGFDPESVSDCSNNGRGRELALQNAAQTPAHDFVPWVVVDGNPLNDDYRNFVRYVCNAYNGSAVPSACSGPSLVKTTKEKPNDFQELVC